MVSWPDDVDQILAGDLTAALAYATPAGGAVVTAVAPIGMRDREAGTVSFTTSLGFGRKLERIKRNPRIALAYHAREHGFAEGPAFVVVQGEASADTDADRDLIEDVIAPQAEPFMGPAKRGKVFWDRWLQEYYADRVPVTVRVERILAWPTGEVGPEPDVYGSPLPAEPPAPQDEPAKGAGPREDVERAARRFGALPNKLLSFPWSDGHPLVLPVSVEGADPGGIRLRCARPLPPGGRRAGVVAHTYNAQLIGLQTRGHTGWLRVDDDPRQAVYAPHTAFGFRAPANKTLLLLANGLLAKRGLKRARRAAAAGAASS
jgi:hypothetical protein